MNPIHETLNPACGEKPLNLEPLYIMLYRNYIASALFLLFVGCATPAVYSRYELEARDIMQRAAALEDSQAYQQAAKEYAVVAEKYSSSGYYQSAVRKTALLNIHPDNPEPDASTALHWLHIYLELPLSPDEKESARLHVAMIERIHHLQAEISRQKEDNIKLRTVNQDQSRRMAGDTQRVKKLVSELAKVRAQLEEMKEVDLRMYSRRVNGSSINPEKLISRTEEINPGTGSPAVSAEKHPEPVKSEEPAAAQKKATPQENGQRPAPYPGTGSPDQERKGPYPYTIQIISSPQKKDAMRTASKSRDRGNLGFTSHAHIPGIGDWYRAFIGLYRNFNEAQAALELIKSEYPDAIVAKMPFALQIEIPPSVEEQEKMEADLQSKGFLAYRIPDKGPNNRVELLIGAFATEEETAKHSKDLEEAGFKTRVVQR